MNSKQELEVRALFRLLVVAKDDQERLQIATELARLGVHTRGSVRTRGTLLRAATGRLLEPEALQTIASLFGNASQPFRCQIALVLAEWGGEGEISAVARTLELDPDESVRLCCITALRTIGGSAAIEALRRAMETGTDIVRDAAVSGIRDLATGGALDDTDSKIVTGLRSRAVLEKLDSQFQTRGPLGSVDARPNLDPVVNTLQQIRADTNLPLHVRLNAEETVRSLR